MAPRLLAIATLLSIAVLLTPQRGRAAADPVAIVPSATGDLLALADLSARLARELRAEEGRLTSPCEAADARDRLRDVRDSALDALNRLGTMWRTGRLRTGTLAASEALTNDLVTVIYRAHRAVAVARALGIQGDGAPSRCANDAASASDRSERNRPSPLGATVP
jgi:hypothetical protein